MSEALFYKAYFKHSLGVEWVLADPAKPQPQQEVSAETSAPYLFVVPDAVRGSSLEKMMERMIVAIKQTPQTLQVLFVREGEDWKTSLKAMTSAKKLIVFGEQLQSGPLGEWSREGVHNVMVTNDLLSIKKQPSLKKETWAHLQSFVGMK